MATGTKKLYPIAPELFYVCPVDAGWKKDARGYVGIDLLSGAAHDAIMQLQPRGVLYPGGSISSWAHLIEGTGEGYNIVESEVVAEGFTLAQPNNGIALIHFGKDFMIEQLQLAKKLGGLMAVINPKYGSQKERERILAICPVKYWILGSEMNVITLYPTSREYLTVAEAIKTSLKEPAVLDVAPEGHTWNNDLKNNSFPIIDYYGHLHDLLQFRPTPTSQPATLSKTDWAHNTKIVFNAYYDSLPKQIDTIRANWGNKGILVEQFSWDYKLPDLNDTMLACMAVGWSYDAFIRYNVKNPGAIVGASTALKGLVFDTTFTNVGKTCKLIGNMFSGIPHFVELTGLPAGCNGFGVWESTTKKYKALIVNKEPTSATLPDVPIDNKTKKCVSWNQNYATSAQDRIVNEISGTGAAVIKPYSVTQINF